MARCLEEREVFPDGITTEWGPAEQPAGSAHWRDADWRAHVRAHNARLKTEGSYTRTRSVEIPDSE